jgi:hypothetical protein
LCFVALNRLILRLDGQLRNMVTKGSISSFVKRQRSLIVGRQRGAGPSPDLPTSLYLCGDAILIICAISAIDKPGQGESPLRMSLPGDFP